MAKILTFCLLQSSTIFYILDFCQDIFKKSTKIYNFGLFSTKFYTLNN